MAGELPGQMRIGAVLGEARACAGLDLRTAEEQTKIRVRYLQALEDEHWDDLPSPAYAKGFLRTYAQWLGLDAEALVDEFRRQVEGGTGGSAYPLARPAQGHRRAPGRDGRGVPKAVVAIALVLGVVAALITIGLLTGGDDAPAPDPDRGGPAESTDRGGRGDNRDARSANDKTVVLELRVREPVEVCLVGGGGEALIDRQVLAAGTEDEFERRRFELRFPGGFEPRQLEVTIAGESRRLPRATGPAAYEIVAPKRVETVDPPAREDCP
jgi:hypothetical protein